MKNVMFTLLEVVFVYGCIIMLDEQGLIQDFMLGGEEGEGIQ